MKGKETPKPSPSQAVFLGLSESYGQAKKDYQIWYYCDVCRERIDMDPNSNSHKEMINYMREHEWGHASCHRQ
ncbi:hypothetical protein ES703_100717 [subsurface metagenome]